MRHIRVILAVAAFGIVAPGVPAAFEPMQGCLVAEEACPAHASINRRTNPGRIAIEPGRTYELRGANRKDATHFQILVPEASPPDRWVETACGRAVTQCRPGGGTEETDPPPATSAENVLAVNWQPAFCEIFRHTSECRSQTPYRFDASHFALHGLWPQPRDNAYCGVGARDRAADEAGRWHVLPAVRLSAATRSNLEEVMPGTHSQLERHQWIKHGTCYGAPPEAYFERSLQLMAELNGSAVRALFAERIGGELHLEEVRAAFDHAFGEGAGKRIEMVCTDGLIAGLRLHLRGEITEAAGLAPLLAAAPPAPESCPAGEVDAAGLR